MRFSDAADGGRVEYILLQDALFQSKSSEGSDAYKVPILERLASHYHATPSQHDQREPGTETATDGEDEALFHQIRCQKEALNLLSRNLPVPRHLLQAVGRPGAVGHLQKLVSQAPGLPKERAVVPPWTEQSRLNSRIQQRLEDLQDVPKNLPNDVQLKLLVEKKALRLAGLQQKLRFDVRTEDRVLRDCSPGRLLEWNRLRRARQDAPPVEPPLMPPPRLAPPLEFTQEELSAAVSKIREQRGREARDHDVARARGEQLRRLAEVRRGLAEERASRQLVQDAQRQEQQRLQVRQQQRRAFLLELLGYREALKPAWAAAAKRRQQRNQGVRTWHGREGRRVSREAAARILALREHNYAEYLRLAHSAKNRRLQSLLEKTDQILSDLGLKVHDQREDHFEAAGAEGDPSPSAAAAWMAGDEDGGGGSGAGAPGEGEGGDSAAAEAERREAEEERAMMAVQRNYYDQVHQVREAVVQPAMLQSGSLRHYQLGGLKFMVSLYNNKMNGILADEMGLGKTIQTISFLAYLMERKANNGPHLILAPKAVLPNWAAEFAKWCPGVDVVMYDGSPEERRSLRAEAVEPGTFNVLLTHYDLVMRDRAALRKVAWEVLIVDEGHRLKNAESKLADILKSYSVRYRILLTGTPLQNSLEELWALLNFVLPRVFNSSENFDEWFAAPFRGQYEASSHQLDDEEQLLVITRLHQVLRPFMLRRTKAEVEKELPAKTECVIKCAMSAWQKLYYKQITEQGRVQMDGGSRGLQNTAMQLRKACNHPYLFLRDAAVAYEAPHPEELVRASGKLELLDRILPKLRAAGHRVLLFSQMTRTLDLIQDYLELRRLPHLRLDGTTKTDDRASMLAAFNAPGSPVFLFMLSTRAGGLGLNLQTADTVIMFDSDWNPQADLQAEDRAHRIGQKRDVLVLVLVTAGSIEAVIQERAHKKRDLDAKVIQAGMFNDASTHTQRQQLLQGLLRRGTEDLGDDVHSEAEVNEMLARSQEERELFTRMDEERRVAGTHRGLMTLEEVPKWVMQPEQAPALEADDAAEEAGPLGRPRRRAARSGSVAYDESLSEKAFIEMIQASSDQEDDESSEPAPAQDRRRRKRAAAAAADSEPRRPPDRPARRSASVSASEKMAAAVAAESGAAATTTNNTRKRRRGADGAAGGSERPQASEATTVAGGGGEGGEESGEEAEVERPRKRGRPPKKVGRPTRAAAPKTRASGATPDGDGGESGSEVAGQGSSAPGRRRTRLSVSRATPQKS